MKFSGVSISKTVVSGTAAVSAGSYQALLDAMRAEEEADGTSGYDTSTSKYYRYYLPSASFPGILVPPRSYKRLSGYLSSSSGFAYFSKSDGLGDLIARGWVATATGGDAVITKTSGSSLIVDSGTGGGNSAHVLLNTSWTEHTSTAQTKSLYVAKLTSVTASATYQSSQNRCMTYIYDGAEVVCLSLKATATNKVGLTKTNAAPHTGCDAGYRAAMPRWYLIEVDNTDSDGDGNRRRLVRYIDLDGHHDEMNYAYMDSTSGVYDSHVYVVYTDTAVGGRNAVHFEEYHCLGYSS